MPDSELIEPPGTTGSPVRAARGCAGTGLVATAPIVAGGVACRFTGRTVPFSAVQPAEIRHVLWMDADRWLIPDAPARFINHGCDPNCFVGDDPRDADAALVIARRSIARGEEIQIAYDRIDGALLAPRADAALMPLWHHEWTFTCRCGAPICRGLVDGYRAKERHASGLRTSRTSASPAAHWASAGNCR